MKRKQITCTNLYIYIYSSLPCCPLSLPCYTPVTLLRHPCDIPATSLRQPMWHPCDTPVTPLRHPCDTPVTPFWNPCDTPAPPLWHPCDTPVTPLWHQARSGVGECATPCAMFSLPRYGYTYIPKYIHKLPTYTSTTEMTNLNFGCSDTLTYRTQQGSAAGTSFYIYIYIQTRSARNRALTHRHTWLPRLPAASQGSISL